MIFRKGWLFALGGFALMAALAASSVTALLYEKPFYSWPNYRGAGPVFAPVALVIVTLFIARAIVIWLKPSKREGHRPPRLFRSMKQNQD